MRPACAASRSGLRIEKRDADTVRFASRVRVPVFARGSTYPVRAGAGLGARMAPDCVVEAARCRRGVEAGPDAMAQPRRNGCIKNGGDRPKRREPGCREVHRRHA